MEEVEGVANSHTTMELVEHNQAWGRYLLSPVSGKRHQFPAGMTESAKGKAGLMQLNDMYDHGLNTPASR